MLRDLAGKKVATAGDAWWVGEGDGRWDGSRRRNTVLEL
jgi:hypothetical protein